MMKYLFLAILGWTSVLAVQAQTNYTPADAGSKVAFAIKNFGVKVEGSLTGLKGSIKFDPARPELSSFSVTVDTKTINTGNERRDNHLRQPDYFDAERFPTLAFKSKSIKKGGGANEFTVRGTITIKGTSKELDFGFTAVPKDGGYLFEGSFEINRLDFGVGSSSLTMAENLEVSLSVLGK